MTAHIDDLNSQTATHAEMMRVLEAQKQSFIDEGKVSVEMRIDRIRRGLDGINKYQKQLTDALTEDYSCRSRELSMLTDITAAIQQLKGATKHVKKWVHREKRKTMFPLNLMGAKSWVEYQPLGTVGVISPWNFPVQLSFGPMGEIFAAGNRVMLKPSEFTPTVSEVIKEIVENTWDETEVAVFTGGPEIGSEFSSLPFDHLLFTGATSIARHVMVAAAKNLVPVTLELGGKSPVIIGRSADIKTTVDRIMIGKTMNAGQICLAPDYLLLPEEKQDEAVKEIQAAVEKMYPKLLDNKHYTSVINERHYQRLQAVVQDAKDKGATVIECNPSNENFEAQQGTFKVAPTIITNTTADMKALQDEIFGPLIPIVTYKDFDETINYVNAHPRPLGAYYFGENKQEERAVVEKTISGGVCINDVMMHASQEDLPFGGVGPAGMGAYHGYDGFKNFSHAKAVYKQTKVDIAGLAGFRPPYGKKTESTIKMQSKY